MARNAAHPSLNDRHRKIAQIQSNGHRPAAAYRDAPASSAASRAGRLVSYGLRKPTRAYAGRERRTLLATLPPGPAKPDGFTLTLTATGVRWHNDVRAAADNGIWSSIRLTPSPSEACETI